MTPPLNDQTFDREWHDSEPYAPPERHAAAWSVTLPDWKITAMLGERCKQSVALADARRIWPICEVSPLTDS